MGQDQLGGGLVPERAERESHFLAGMAKDLSELKSGPAWYRERWWAGKGCVEGSKRPGFLSWQHQP